MLSRAAHAAPGPADLQRRDVGLSSREVVGGVRIELNVTEVTELKGRAGDVRVDRRRRQWPFRRRVDGDVAADGFFDPGQRRDARRIDGRFHREVGDRRIERLDRSCDLGARSHALHFDTLDRDIVLAEIDLAGRSIDRRLAILDANMSSGCLELNLVTVREVVAAHLNRRQRKLRVDLFRSILVSHLRPSDRERRDEVVERLVGCVRIRWWTRKVVASLLIDDVVDVDVFDRA